MWVRSFTLRKLFNHKRLVFFWVVEENDKRRFCFLLIFIIESLFVEFIGFYLNGKREPLEVGDDERTQSIQRQVFGPQNEVFQIADHSGRRADEQVPILWLINAEDVEYADDRLDLLNVAFTSVHKVILFELIHLQFIFRDVLYDDIKLNVFFRFDYLVKVFS
jgi:hypothetical protein